MVASARGPAEPDAVDDVRDDGGRRAARGCRGVVPSGAGDRCDGRWRRGRSRWRGRGGEVGRVRCRAGHADPAQQGGDVVGGRVPGRASARNGGGVGEAEQAEEVGSRCGGRVRFRSRGSGPGALVLARSQAAVRAPMTSPARRERRSGGYLAPRLRGSVRPGGVRPRGRDQLGPQLRDQHPRPLRARPCPGPGLALWSSTSWESIEAAKINRRGRTHCRCLPTQ